MTKQESFKRLVRARMAKTGEKYGAARRALIERASSPSPEPQGWVEEPETTDDAVREATGRTWDEWCELIDAWPERDQGHAAMAVRIGRDHLDNGWWAQAVIVGYERIRGLRTKYMRADGTFAGSVTRTIPLDIDALRTELLDPDAVTRIVNLDARAVEVQADATQLRVEVRSKPTSKALRWAIHPGQGSVLFSLDPRPDGRVRIAIQHENLPSAEAVDGWKEFWTEWLASRDGSS